MERTKKKDEKKQRKLERSDDDTVPAEGADGTEAEAVTEEA